jgi:bifunctional DNA-binding transcriptional regulator/antitoxin component of YhaV-PrlF toxin-antitoxin module
VAAAVKHDDEPPRRRSKLSSKNQVTLPVAALAAAHIKSGDELQVEVVGDGVLRLVRYRDPRLDLLNEIIGSAPGISAAANLEELRDEWER